MVRCLKFNEMANCVESNWIHWNHEASISPATELNLPMNLEGRTFLIFNFFISSENRYFGLPMMFTSNVIPRF